MSCPLPHGADFLRAGDSADAYAGARAYAVRRRAGDVYLSEDDYEIDWASFAFVAVDDAYAGDYRGACVVDLGAHKGYYGAYALRHGARAVVSYEPERANASFLERSAAAASRCTRLANGEDAARSGRSRARPDLHVMGASWGHALHPAGGVGRARGGRRARPESTRSQTCSRRRPSTARGDARS